MSRGFVKEDDQEEAPFIPPRAPLPDGVPNHVTPRGLQLLQDERADLEEQRATLLRKMQDERSGSNELRQELAVIDGRLALLNERIVTARVVEPGDHPPEEVRFGTTVTFIYLDGPQVGIERTFTIVGVDEAHVKEARIAFTSPIARALLGKRVNDVVTFMPGGTAQHLNVSRIV